MITRSTESGDAFYTRRQDELRAEIHRVRSARTPTAERRRLVRRLVSAVRELQTARDYPEEFTWQYYTAQMSWLRIFGIVAGVIVVVLITPEALRRGNEWSVASVLLLATFSGVTMAVIRGSWPLTEGLDRRRKLRAALRLAERTRSGKRRPRAEAIDAPFVGPPAADLLVLASLVIGVLMSHGGFRLEGAFVGLLSMLVFVLALARRIKLRLALPFVNDRARRILSLAVAACFLLALLAGWTASAILSRVGLLALGLPFYYMATAGLAEEAVISRSDIVRLDEQPVSYWLHLSLYLAMAFGLAGLALLIPDIPYHRGN